MKFFLLRLFSAIFLFASLHSKVSASPVESALNCPLPPPEGLTITGVTATSISLEWQPVINGTPPYYKISVIDLTDPASLPDVYTTSTYYTYTGLIPDHEYELCVSTTACENGETGDPVCVEGRTTGIIIDNIVQNSCTLGSGNVVLQGNSETVTLTPAEEQSTEVDVKRYKIAQAQPLNDSYVEFTLWADCGNPPLLHFREIGQSNTSRYPQNTPDDPVENIAYFNGNGVFFRLHSPSPTSLGYYSVILTYYQNSIVQNCSGNQGECDGCCEGSSRGSMPSDNSDDMQDASAVALSVKPNPTSGALRAEYKLLTESVVAFRLFDITGHILKVVETPAAMEAGDHIIDFPIEDLPPGIYFLALQTDKERKLTTFIKQ